VLLDDDRPRDDGHGFGAALVWALRRGATSLSVVTGRGSAIIARRAGEFALPIAVWTVDGTELRPAVGEPAGLEVPADALHLDLIPAIEAAGATAVVEHGVVSGEVRGLEVCRVVTASDDPSVIRLEVGIGAHDREAFGLLHADVPPGEALARVVAAIAAYRDPRAAGHALNRLVPERLLRWRLAEQPDALGLAELRAVASPVPRPGLKERTACTALGRRPDGTEVLVVTSVGVDLDVIPYAADARLDYGGDAETIVVAPARDLVAATRELNAALRRPVALVPAP